MAQFDSLIIFSLIWSLLFILILHYNVSIGNLIPSFFSVKKLREKKLNSPSSYEFLQSVPKTKSHNSYLITF